MAFEYNIYNNDIRESLNKIIGKAKMDKLYNNIPGQEIFTMNEAELRAYGASPKMAQNIVEIFNIKRTPILISNKRKLKIKSSKDAFNHIDGIGLLDREVFVILYLKTDNTVFHHEFHSIGSAGGTVADVATICRNVVVYKAKAVIIAHNHPSGNMAFSKADISISKKIKEALKFVDAILLDSMVFCGNSYLSMADKGLI